MALAALHSVSGAVREEKSRLSRLVGAARGLAKGGEKKGVAARLAQMPLFVLGLGCIDAGVFWAGAVAGFIVTGLSLILLEYVAAED